MAIAAERTIEEPGELHPPRHGDWWQRFELLLSLHLPDLTGKSVLDIDAYDGYFSLAAERFGARRVLAVDRYWDTHPGVRIGFERRRVATSSRVQVTHSDSLQDPPARARAFDVVLLLGVLDRVGEPLRALRAAARAAGELLVVETFTRAQRAAELRATLETLGFAQVASHRRALAADLLRRRLLQRRLVVHCRR